ncbi:putative ribosomal protein MRP49 [Drechmeria coniospora]|uniref:Putative ribosomal protein MRP49 n=1 Tax=Drechmeria coniospora TaxID=98403 RepID=A0A151GFA8_DRECN|nr:putative ribosomal protein MRP49 [Drechmeria coniospora]KYK55742.1 putative ribosomal protein MRP49 [Drechmeria coniospora]
MNGGHMGAKKFWRECLPRLKYHNPSIPMIVNRHGQNQTPPAMTIYLRTTGDAPSSDSTTAIPEHHMQPASSRTGLSKAQPPNPGERVVRIDMKGKHSSDILEFLVAETRATVLKPAAEDIAEMQALEAMKKQAVIDGERVRQLRAERKKEEDMLKRARAAGGVAEQDAA